MSNQQPRDPKSQGAKRFDPDSPQVPDPSPETQGSAAADLPDESTGARRFDPAAARVEKKADMCSTALHDDTYFNEKWTNRWRDCSGAAQFQAALALELGKIRLYPPLPGDKTVDVTYGDASTTCTMPLGRALEAVRFIMEPDVVYYLPVTGPERYLVDGTEVTGLNIHTKGWDSRSRNKRTPADDQTKAGAANAKAGKKRGTKETTKETGTETEPDDTETPT